MAGLADEGMRDLVKNGVEHLPLVVGSCQVPGKRHRAVVETARAEPPTRMVESEPPAGLGQAVVVQESGRHALGFCKIHEWRRSARGSVGVRTKFKIGTGTAPCLPV